MNPEDIYLYRITHFRNLEHILRYGLLCPNHPQADPNYVGIGDKSLIQVRNALAIPIPPGGTMRDYVAFYFGAHSPMLLQIITGYEGVKRLPQREIIYVVCQMSKIIESNLPFVFTDGHARNLISAYYNDVNDLVNVDWNVVKEKQWNNTEEDPDRKRRKQAEFLVSQEIPSSCIHAILVYDAERHRFAEEAVKAAGLAIQVHLNTNARWYY
jgi:hypothetical protein